MLPSSSGGNVALRDCAGGTNFQIIADKPHPCPSGSLGRTRFASAAQTSNPPHHLDALTPSSAPFSAVFSRACLISFSEGKPVGGSKTRAGAIRFGTNSRKAHNFYAGRRWAGAWLSAKPGSRSACFRRTFSCSRACISTGSLRPAVSSSR